jgi:UDP-glucose 4-epimerase
MNILLTGGVGYIGSHTVVELINAGHNVIIVDNLINSNISVLDKIEIITKVRPLFYNLNIQDSVALDKVFSEHKIDAVIHFAALKAVGESVIKPLSYYKNNISGSIVLFEVMQQHNVKKIVFSSSATVYGDPETTPITEDFPLHTTNPYGFGKLAIEQVLRDIYNADNSWSIALLRYFNPVGAHKSGLIGENPNGIPNNLMPYIAQVAIGQREFLTVFGNDYPTHDGTGVRDYIHVVDLAIGHLQALEYFAKNKNELITVNLGTGVGYSVLDVVRAYEAASGRKIPYKFAPRRSGDIATCYANPDIAYKLLGFKTKFGIEEMCLDSWNFQQNLNI